MTWKTRAACRGRGDIDWDGFGPMQVLICSGCEVRAECLHAGLQETEAGGTWGMTSEAQRNRLRAGKATVTELWETNETEARGWLDDRLTQPTLVWER